eukprot:741096-Pleurochrysis_carterae.AAC.1
MRVDVKTRIDAELLSKAFDIVTSNPTMKMRSTASRSASCQRETWRDGTIAGVLKERENLKLLRSCRNHAVMEGGESTSVSAAQGDVL